MLRSLRAVVPMLHARVCVTFLLKIWGKGMCTVTRERKEERKQEYEGWMAEKERNSFKETITPNQTT